MELVKFKEQINDTIALFDPEMSQQLGQNLFTYFLLNRVEVTDDEVIISVKQRGEMKKINYNKGQFFAKMIDMARNGFDLLAGDFTLTPFWDATFKQYSPSVVISYKKHLQILKEKGYAVNVYYLRKGDTFVEIKPYFHKFDIKPKTNLTKKIENGKAINDILFYGVEIVKNSTGQPVCSYVESTENIKARANFNNDIFPNSPNSQDTMYVKFVLNRAYEFLMKYGENSLPDIDKLENYASLALVDVDEVKQIETPEPQTFKKLKKLDKNSKLWETAIKRLNEKTATIEQITANFEVDENDLLELRDAATKNLQDPEQNNNGGLSNEI